MIRERELIARLRRFATAPEARGLLDDVALLDRLVITHDTIAEGVHFLSSDPPASVGWKLVAVNLSDLAAKGATPAGALLSLTISGPSAWAIDFLSGVEAACERYGLTAIGRAGKRVPDRAGGRAGDRLWLVGTVGDAAAGLAQLKDDPRAAGPLVDIFRRPVPLLRPGQALAPKAHAMMDVSDGLLLDAQRMAEASGCGIVIDLDSLPLSRAFIAERGNGLQSRLFAATGGDDYALLAALPERVNPSTLSLPEGTTIACIGRLEPGPPMIRLASEGRPVELPEKLGFEHSDDQHRRLPGPPVADRA